MNKKLILVDGTSYLYRAFYALPSLISPQGKPTGAIYGVVSMLHKVIKNYRPDYMAVVFDSKEKTFRSDLYASYKAQRALMPELLQEQIKPLHALIHALGLPLFIVPGVEADDIIGTLVQHNRTETSILICSNDKDFAQLVTPDIKLVDTKNNRVLDPIGVLKKFGVEPKKILDYLCLIGDSSDNIPGIPFVGPETAVRWLDRYDTLDAICQHAHELTGKAAIQLRLHQDRLKLNRALIQIKTDVGLSITLEDLSLKTPDYEMLVPLYEELGFQTWLDKLKTQTSTKQTKHSYTDGLCIQTKETFKIWFERLKQAPVFAVHAQGNHAEPMRSELFGLAFALPDDEPIYIPLCATDQTTAILDRDWVLKYISPVLNNPHQQKIGHDLKYDQILLHQHGLKLAEPYWDTLLAAYVLNNTLSEAKTNTVHYLTTKTVHTTEQDSACKAVITALQQQEELKERLQQDVDAYAVLTQLDLPLISILAKMEQHGVLIDTHLLQQQSKNLGERLANLESQAYQHAGKVFNLNSPKQLQEILFVEQGLPILEKTPKGQPSTAETILQRLSTQFQLPGLILEHRTLSKLKSTYTDKLPQQINPKTGRIHTSYHQALVVTGRLSSSNPNLQNIPIRDHLGRKIRQAFIAAPGYQILAADYSQIELRIMAHLSQDPGLLAAFASNLDVHQATAAEILGIPLEQVSSDQRRSAKAVNFGLIYGMSAFGLAKQLGIERVQAQNYIDRYFARYPKVKEYMEHTRAQAHEQGFVHTLFKRRIHLPGIHSRNRLEQQASERAAINAPLQGSAADIIKQAMIQIDRHLLQNKLNAHLIMQVHDELVFEIATSNSENARKIIETDMQSAASLTVPLLIDIHIGSNWADAEI